MSKENVKYNLKNANVKVCKLKVRNHPKSKYRAEHFHKEAERSAMAPQFIRMGVFQPQRCASFCGFASREYKKSAKTIAAECGLTLFASY